MTKVENGGKPDVKSGKSEKERSNKRAHKKEKQKPQTKVCLLVTWSIFKWLLITYKNVDILIIS